jgi:hypothetical protein
VLEVLAVVEEALITHLAVQMALLVLLTWAVAVVAVTTMVTHQVLVALAL